MRHDKRKLLGTKGIATRSKNATRSKKLLCEAGGDGVDLFNRLPPKFHQGTRSEPAKSTTFSLEKRTLQMLKANSEALIFQISLYSDLTRKTQSFVDFWPGDGALHLLTCLGSLEDPLALGDPQLEDGVTPTRGLKQRAKGRLSTRS